MRYQLITAALAAAVACGFAGSARPRPISKSPIGGHPAAKPPQLREFAKAFDATGNKWVDGAIAGSGDTARPIMVSRITGGDPMGATQFNHGRQAEELVQAGLMRDLTDLATKEKWTEIIRPDEPARRLHGRRQDLLRAGQHPLLAVAVAVQQGVRRRRRAGSEELGRVRRGRAGARRQAGNIPLAVGGQPWQTSGAFNVLMVGDRRQGRLLKVYRTRTRPLRPDPRSPRSSRRPTTPARCRKGSNVQDWNQATNLVITGQAGGQIMGDWAQGEFQVAGQVAGKDYTCLPGLGVNEIISTGGDAFYFPMLKDPDKTAAQDVLASTMLNPATQVAFNLKKGSLPVRGDVDLAAANDCMKKGLDILAKGNIDHLGRPTSYAADTQKQKKDLSASSSKRRA